jgi:hypothetical protein
VTNLEGYGYMIGVLDLERLGHFHSKRPYAAISILRGPERLIAYDGSQAPEGRFPQTSRLCTQNITDCVDLVLTRQGGKY